MLLGDIGAMRLLKALIAVAVLVGSASSVAFAQKSTRDAGWSGLYVGGFLGHARGSSDFVTDTGEETFTSYFFASSIVSVNQTGTGSVDDDALVGGVVAGRNFQSGKIVYGIEVDFGSFRLRNSIGGTNVPYPNGAGDYSMRASIETDWLVTARARIGWTLTSNLLIYATGGLAVTKVRVANAFSDTAFEEGVGGASDEETKIGWTIGGGAEWALSRGWSFKAEYLHVDFGSTKASGSIFCGPNIAAQCNVAGLTPNSFTSSADLSADIVRLGLNYRF